MASKNKPGKGKKDRKSLDAVTSANTTTKQRNKAEQNLLHHKLNDLDQQRRRSIQAITGQERDILRNLQRQEQLKLSKDQTDTHLSAPDDYSPGSRRSSTTSTTSSSRRGSSQSVDLDAEKLGYKLNDVIRNSARPRRHSLDLSAFRDRGMARFQDGNVEDFSDIETLTLPVPVLKNNTLKPLSESEKNKTKSNLPGYTSILRKQSLGGIEDDKSKSKSVNFSTTVSEVEHSEQDVIPAIGRPKLTPVSFNLHGNSDENYKTLGQSEQKLKENRLRRESTDLSSGSGNTVYYVSKHSRGANESVLDSLYKDHMRPRSYSGSFVGTKAPLTGAKNRLSLEPLQRGKTDVTMGTLHAQRNGFKSRGKDEQKLPVSSSNGVTESENRKREKSLNNLKLRDVGSIGVHSSLGSSPRSSYNRQRRNSLPASRVLSRLTGDPDPNDTRTQWDDLGKYLGEIRKHHEIHSNSTISKPRTPNPQDSDQSTLESLHPPTLGQSKLLSRRNSETNFLVGANTAQHNQALETKFYRAPRQKQTVSPPDYPCALADDRNSNTTIKKLATVHSILQSSALSMADAEPEMF